MLKKVCREYFSPTGWVEEPEDPIIISLWDEEEDEKNKDEDKEE